MKDHNICSMAISIVGMLCALAIMVIVGDYVVYFLGMVILYSLGWMLGSNAAEYSHRKNLVKLQ